MRMVVAVTVFVFAGRVSTGEIIHVVSPGGKNIVEAVAKFFRKKPVKPIEREQLRFILPSEKPNAARRAIEEPKLNQAEEKMWEAADQETREIIERIRSVLDRDNEEDAAEMAKAEDKDWKLECTRGFAQALKEITCSSIKTYIKTDKPPTDQELDHDALKAFGKASVSCGKHIANRGKSAESAESAARLKVVSKLKSLQTLAELFNDIKATPDAIKRLELLLAYVCCR
jgi:hypothetical protein